MEIQPSSTSRRILVALAIILVITAFALIALNAYTIQPTPLRIVPKKTAEQGYVEGYLAARAKYQTLCPNIGTEMTYFMGTIESVSGQSITVRQTSLDTDPTIDKISDVRTVTIGATTNIEKAITKTPEQMQADLLTFQKGLKAGATSTPPITSVALKTTDLKVGQTVYIQSGSDVRLAPIISASVIRILK